MSVAAGRALMTAMRQPQGDGRASRMPHGRAGRVLGALLVALLAVTSGAGCITTVYQPLTSLQRPVVVDPQLANFEGVKLLVRCHPSENLSANDAVKLCRSVSTNFRNQGALVEVEIPRPNRGANPRDEGENPDLVMDLRSRMVNQHDGGALIILTYLTLTMVPMVQEYTLAQDVTLRDRDGTILVQDTMQGRFVEYLGFGVWAVNAFADYTFRKKEDRITGDAPKKDFSRDFYGQLSQLALNAHVRQRVLREFQPAEPTTPSTPAPAPSIPAPRLGDTGGQRQPLTAPASALTGGEEK